MPRPAVHDTETLLDAAVSLYTDGGEGAITMAAVARASGAPSGSVYHRFPDRASLLAALWLRTMTRFQAGIVDLVADREPGVTLAVECARHVVTWCSRNGGDARVLVAGREVFDPAGWPDAATKELRRLDATFAAAVRRVFDGVIADTAVDARLARLAVIELPYAAVRPFLSRGKPIPGHVEATVVAAVGKLLA